MATVTREPGRTEIPSTLQDPAAESVPLLENGDRLTRAEFERRYNAMPDLKKAELIEGVVYVGSPVSHENHGKPHFHLICWLGQYWTATPVVEGGDNSSLRLDLDNMPQPDAFLYILPELGGQVRIAPDEYIERAPELVAEVASSYDLHDKLHVYRRNGVLEYVVWRVRDNAVDWFILREGRYERLVPGDDGILRSETFPGLWLDTTALLGGDRATVMRSVQQGVATPEHAAFVARLQAQAKPPA